MLHDGPNNGVLKSLVGNIEWIYAKPYFNDSLRIVFRKDGQLSGIEIEKRDIGTRYGQFGVSRSGVTDFIIHPMDRFDVLNLVAYINESLFLSQERAEWVQRCEYNEYKRAEAEQERERARLENERRELERLKAKFENGGPK